ncbi:MAG: DUF2208 family protein [Ignisphaera sp.]|uniref:DUF2208 domain-containing protein n=1 Tax=Ignisphaera aggregans TaxID=334771 RepID=A0A7C4NML5_9CREN
MRVDKIQIINTVIWIIVFSLISTFLPREYLMIVIIIYAFAYTIIINSMQRIKSKKKTPEGKGVVLLRSNEKTVMDIVMRDQELFRELGKQTRGLFIWFIATLPIVFLVMPTLSSMVLGSEVTSFIEKFLRYSILYTIMWSVMYGLRLISMPRKMLVPVTKYEVHSIGIKYGNMWIQFPLDQERYKVIPNHKRGFIEIYDTKMGQAYRFYSEDSQKLFSIIEKYGLKK